jgi:hypothetical protein
VKENIFEGLSTGNSITGCFTNSNWCWLCCHHGF